MKDLLPIGSVVTLKEGTKTLLIIGLLQQEVDTNTLHDYIACLYPEGYINHETMFLFDHEDIEEVNYIGFINAEAQLHHETLGRLMEEAGDALKA